MARYSSSIVIRRPLDEVYAYMDDVDREMEWQPSLRSAAKSPPGDTKVGTRKIYESEFLGRRVKNVYEVIEFDPGRRVVQQTMAGSSAKIWSEVRWSDHPEGTLVTLTVDAEPQGILRLIPRQFLESATRTELEGSLEKLRRAMERSA